MLKCCTTLYRAVKEITIEYLQKTSINGFGLLYYIRRRKYQRLLWCTFIMMGLSFAIYVVAFTLHNFLQAPTETSLECDDYSVEELPFPALTVCSVNQLSRRAVAAYIEQMRKRYQQQAHAYTNANMKLLSGLFDSATVDFAEAAAFQREVLDKQNEATRFNVTEMLKLLAPSCSVLLIACRWAGRLVACNDYFAQHATTDGYCCLFNYRRLREQSSKPLLYPNGIGQKMGLTLLLNTSIDDYYLTTRSTVGFSMQIFDPVDFPDDTTSSSTQQSFIPPGADVKLQLSIFTQTATNATRVYSAQQRHCYFDDENDGENYYSQGECLMRCKAEYMLSGCGCVPFYMPADMVNRSSSKVPFCTLADVECMNNVRWNTYQPISSGHGYDRLEHKFSNDSLDCRYCLSVCDYNFYVYSKEIDSLKYAYDSPENRQFFSLTAETRRAKVVIAANNLQHKDTSAYSLVKIYFPYISTVKYTKNVLYNWYQILSNIGGVIGICMGFSLISGFEIIYYFTFRLIGKLYKSTQVAPSVLK